MLAFSLIHLIRGDPVQVMGGERRLDPPFHAETLRRLGLDRPLAEPYGACLWRALQLALPVSGRMAFEFDMAPRTGFMLLDAWLSGEPGAVRSALSHLVLPSVGLGTVALAVIARMTRFSMLEVLREDYVRTARAKGLSPARVVFVHGLRNAAVPVVTVVTVIGRRDHPVVQGGILISATLVIAVNLGVDLLYGWITPRIRHAR